MLKIYSNSLVDVNDNEECYSYNVLSTVPTGVSFFKERRRAGDYFMVVMATTDLLVCDCSIPERTILLC